MTWCIVQEPSLASFMFNYLRRMQLLNFLSERGAVLAHFLCEALGGIKESFCERCYLQRDSTLACLELGIIWNGPSESGRSYRWGGLNLTIALFYLASIYCTKFPLEDDPNLAWLRDYFSQCLAETSKASNHEWVKKLSLKSQWYVLSRCYSACMVGKGYMFLHVCWSIEKLPASKRSHTLTLPQGK